MTDTVFIPTTADEAEDELLRVAHYGEEITIEEWFALCRCKEYARKFPFTVEREGIRPEVFTHQCGYYTLPEAIALFRALYWKGRLVRHGAGYMPVEKKEWMR